MTDAPILLITLGTSPAIVPEAFLLPNTHFQSVHVLTTERPDVGLIREFFTQVPLPGGLSITRVAGFEDFVSEQDHFNFEEVLYRWVIDCGAEPASRCFCLSGGFKTMSAAMQKAAAVLGAVEVFHVLADACCPGADGRGRPPGCIQEVRTAVRGGHLHWIRLGPESGWPQFRHATPTEYPLEVLSEVDGVRRARAPDRSFRDRLRSVVDRSHRIAGAWDRLPELPFVELATWPAADLEWLSAPLEPADPVDRAWIERLPKVELHCHLGGFATHGTLLREVRSAAKRPARLPPLDEPELPSGWPIPEEPVPLEHYMRLGNANGSTLLKDPGCLRRQCELLYRHLLDQHVLYAEIRCSPANYANPDADRSAWTVIEEIRETFHHCLNAARAARSTSASAPPPCLVNLIIIATRQDHGGRSTIARHLALAITAADRWRNPADCRVVGVDRAGFENRETRAALFQTDFEAVHRVGLAVTVHAGENDDAEGIWQAAFLNADARAGLGRDFSSAISPP